MNKVGRENCAVVVTVEKGKEKIFDDKIDQTANNKKNT